MLYKRGSEGNHNCDDVITHGCPLLWRLTPYVNVFQPMVGFTIDASLPLDDLPSGADWFRGIEFDAYRRQSNKHKRHLTEFIEVTPSDIGAVFVEETFVCDRFGINQILAMTADTGSFDVENLCPDARQVEGFDGVPLGIEHYEMSEPLSIDLTDPESVKTFSVYWPNVYPDEEIYVGNLRMLYSLTESGPVYMFAKVDPGVFDASVGECESADEPAFNWCECDNGCTGSEIVEMSYYAAPALVANGSLPSTPEARRRVATLETRDVDSMLELIFEEDQRIYQVFLPDQGPDIANANAGYIAGGPVSTAEDCAIQMRVVACSGNLQVWVRPNATVVRVQDRRRASAKQRVTIECKVHTISERCSVASSRRRRYPSPGVYTVIQSD
jgi:hypothetical protein